MRWLLLIVAVACEVTASLALKAALDRPGLYVVVAIGYVASLVLLTKVLQFGVPLGVAYGIWGALGVGATAGLAAVVFGEPFTPLMGLGLAVAIAGVLLVEFGSHAADPS